MTIKGSLHAVAFYTTVKNFEPKSAKIRFFGPSFLLQGTLSSASRMYLYFMTAELASSGKISRPSDERRQKIASEKNKRRTAAKSKGFLLDVSAVRGKS